MKFDYKFYLIFIIIHFVILTVRGEMLFCEISPNIVSLKSYQSINSIPPQMRATELMNNSRMVKNPDIILLKKLSKPKDNKLLNSITYKPPIEQKTSIQYNREINSVKEEAFKEAATRKLNDNPENKTFFRKYIIDPIKKKLDSELYKPLIFIGVGFALLGISFFFIGLLRFFITLGGMATVVLGAIYLIDYFRDL